MNSTVRIRMGQKGVWADVALRPTLNGRFETPEGSGKYQMMIWPDEIVIRSFDDHVVWDDGEEGAGYFLREYCKYQGRWSVYLADWTGEYRMIDDEESISALESHHFPESDRQ